MTTHTSRKPSRTSPRQPVANSASDGTFRQAGIALVLAVAIASPILGVGGSATYAAWTERRETDRVAMFNTMAYERLIEAPARETVALDTAVHGRDLFTTSCAACHGADARGLEFMGKDLVTSDFVARLSDDDLRKFVIEGRVARPLSMPPRGGHPDLGDDDIGQIVVYLRGMQDPRRMPDLPAPVVTGPSEEQQKAALAAAGGDAELAEFIASGDKLFHTTCVACHGKGGVGVKGNGAVLVGNEFVRSLDDDGLLAFIKQGRGPSDPKNKSGVQMPPKGGNPALSDDDILDIVAYLRTLQPKEVAKSGG